LKIVSLSLWDYHWIIVYYFFVQVNANSVIQVYKFKQIFKKIGQTKALYLSYVFPRICTLLLSYWNDGSEKQTHLCRTIELSDYQAIGLTGCGIIATIPKIHLHIGNKDWADCFLSSGSRIHLFKSALKVSGNKTINDNYFFSPDCQQLDKSIPHNLTYLFSITNSSNLTISSIEIDHFLVVWFLVRTQIFIFLLLWIDV
jgi:hypothetical protein